MQLRDGEQNCYLVLGVARGETAAGIRSAYHALARRFRPDRIDEDGARVLAEIDAAYAVLSDVHQRLLHDQELRVHEAALPAATTPAEPLLPDRPSLDPFAPPAVALLDDADSVRPSMEALRQRFLRGFTGRGVPKSEHLEALNLEIVLSPEDAARGSRLAIGLPIFARCLACDGGGHVWGAPCAACDQQGVIATEAEVAVRIPALTRSGTRIEVPLHGFGVHNFIIVLHVFVHARAAGYPAH